MHSQLEPKQEGPGGGDAGYVTAARKRGEKGGAGREMYPPGHAPGYPPPARPCLWQPVSYETSLSQPTVKAGTHELTIFQTTRLPGHPTLNHHDGAGAAVFSVASEWCWLNKNEFGRVYFLEEFGQVWHSFFESWNYAVLGFFSLLFPSSYL